MYELIVWVTALSGCLIMIPNIVVELDKLCSRLDERSEARREKFRIQAYKDMNERLSLKKNRQELWLSIRK